VCSSDLWAYNYQPKGTFWHLINTDGTYEIDEINDVDYEEVDN
jgi:hypothetical protein